MLWRILLDRLASRLWPKPPPPDEAPEGYEYLDWPVLTDREIEVAWYVCQGMTNEEIAAQLNVTRSTIKHHVHSLLMKFNLRSRWVLREMLNNSDYKPWGEAS